VAVPKTTLRTLAEWVDGKGEGGADFLVDAGGKLGAFAVTDLGPEYSEAVESFRTSAPKCLVPILRNPVWAETLSGQAFNLN
jgi:hypothetical protein